MRSARYVYFIILLTLLCYSFYRFYPFWEKGLFVCYQHNTGPDFRIVSGFNQDRLTNYYGTKISTDEFYSLHDLDRPDGFAHTQNMRVITYRFAGIRRDGVSEYAVLEIKDSASYNELVVSGIVAIAVLIISVAVNRK